MDATNTWQVRRRQEESWPLRGAACVIEPDDVDRQSIASLLRHMGFSTHEAESGIIGRLIVEQISLSVVVINVMIKDVQALRLIREMRDHAPGALIIALTSEPRALELSCVAGADFVLASPPCGEALCATITQALEASHHYTPGAHSPTFETTTP
jgi:DNA-binding response OmpR family regulator